MVAIAPAYTLAEGQPRHRNDTTEQVRVGSGGGFLLMTSTQLLETLAHFSRERIPERSVHAKASGARGHFEVTDDVSDVTDADFFNGIGKKTECLVRIATTGPKAGSADTVRDFRGFSMKFKTAEGNQDFVFNNQPVFFVRDPVKFPSLNRSHKPDPKTNRPSSDMFWDFHVNNPEGIHALMFLFGDRGLPASVRHTNAYSGNTYKFSKADGSYHYTRIHVIATKGTKYLSNPEAAVIAGVNPDYHNQDLQDAIARKDFPSWDISIQTMHPDKIGEADFDIFDMTKVWPKGQYPLRKIGRMMLDTNPDNYFTAIEQAAFSPSNMVRGIEPSPDPMLQARMFAYPDAARYRLGVNYQFLPTNAAKQAYCPTERDGFMNFTSNYGDDPNYVGTKIKPIKFESFSQGGPNAAPRPTTANVGQLDQASAGAAPRSFVSEVTDKDFVQARAYWHMIAKQEGAQQRLIENAAAHIAGCTRKWLRDGAYEQFAKVDKGLGERIKQTAEHKIENDHAHPHKSAWH